MKVFWTSLLENEIPQNTPLLCGQQSPFRESQQKIEVACKVPKGNTPEGANIQRK
jgi:hypothetical protein